MALTLKSNVLAFTKHGDIEEAGLQGWMRSQAKCELADRHHRAARECQLDYESTFIDVALASTKRAAEIRDQSAVSGPAGAYAVAGGFSQTIELALLDSSPIRRLAEVVRAADGGTYAWATADDTAEEGEILAENAQSGEADVSFGAMNFKPTKFGSKRVQVPNELLEDAVPDFTPKLGRILGERIGRIQNRIFTTELLRTATLGVAAASATAIASDELIDLIFSIDPSYREQPGAGFMAHSNLIRELKQLKDSGGRYIFRDAAGSRPASLDGYPVYFNRHMASTMASGGKSLLFGDFSRMKIVDALVLRIQSLVETYASIDQTAFVAYLRSQMILNTSGDPVKYLQQA